MSFSRSQGDARKRHVRFADSALVGSLAEIHEYEVSECPLISPRTFDECCEELLERMDIPDLAVRNSALSHVQGRVLHLATTWRGSHVVKRALEIARREEQEALVSWPPRSRVGARPLLPGKPGAAVVSPVATRQKRAFHLC